MMEMNAKGKRKKESKSRNIITIGNGCMDSETAVTFGTNKISCSTNRYYLWYICMKTVIYFTQFVDPIRLSGYLIKLDTRYGVKWVVKHVTSHVEAAFAQMD